MNITYAFMQYYSPTDCTNAVSIYMTGSRGSSVSIVSGYGLDDLAIEVRCQVEAKDFS
jgi:hypothetical protein